MKTTTKRLMKGLRRLVPNRSESSDRRAAARFIRNNKQRVRKAAMYTGK